MNDLESPSPSGADTRTVGVETATTLETKRSASAFTKVVLYTSLVLPLITTGTCSAASRDGSQEWLTMLAFALFGLSLVATLVLLLFAISGRQRALSLLALAFNVGGIIASVSQALSDISFTRGRQIRGPNGRVLPVRGLEALPVELPARAARAWRDNGDTETASISAFALLSLDLAQLGAPLDLVRAAHEDALDEIRHAELCYALGRSLGDGGPAVAPMSELATVRGRACTFARVAVESWMEGAYLETVSAELARGLCPFVEDVRIRAVLEVIAVDEARHARHAWDVVQWCLEREPAVVVPALRKVMATSTSPRSPEKRQSDDDLLPYGIPAPARQDAVAAFCLSEAKVRLQALLERALGLTDHTPRGAAIGS